MLGSRIPWGSLFSSPSLPIANRFLRTGPLLRFTLRRGTTAWQSTLCREFLPSPSELECRVYLEAAGITTDYESLVPAEAGEIEECFASPCACYCVLKRPGGFLLAVPANSLDEAVLASAEDADSG